MLLLTWNIIANALSGNQKKPAEECQGVLLRQKLNHLISELIGTHSVGMKQHSGIGSTAV